MISYSTAERTSEFGVRLALGAQPQDLIKAVLQQGVKRALIGMGIGFAAAAAVVRFMQSLLFEVKPLDLTVFASVGGGLLLVSLAASIVPALRTDVLQIGNSKGSALTRRPACYAAMP